MTSLPPSIIFVIAVLTLFLSTAVALRYAIEDNFARTRFLMTGYFLFIVVTLTISFWEDTLVTLPYTIPSLFVGMLFGYLLGVRAAEQRIAMEGIAYYMKHFAHIHLGDWQHFTWWNFVNFYTVLGALILINLEGLANVIFGGSEMLSIVTAVVGALLIGSILPYLAHLWSLKAKDQ